MEIMKKPLLFEGERRVLKQGPKRKGNLNYSRFVTEGKWKR